MCQARRANDRACLRARGAARVAIDNARAALDVARSHAAASDAIPAPASPPARASRAQVADMRRARPRGPTPRSRQPV
jgi:hypothetical protein